MSRFRIVVAAVLILAGWSLDAAQAAKLELQFTGIDWIYDGFRLYDAKTHFGGAWLAYESDPLTSLVLLVDDVPVAAALTNDICVDVLFERLRDIPVGGGLVKSEGNYDNFGVDVFKTNPAESVALQVHEINFLYDPTNRAFAVTGTATGIYTQDLPYALAFDPSQPIRFAFSSSNVYDVVTGGDIVKWFWATGTGSITGTLIPEPTVLWAMGGATLLLRRRRAS